MTGHMFGMSAYKHLDRSQSPQRGSIRIKSEAPLDTQIRSASSYDLDHQRRMRVLQGLPPDRPSIGDILGGFQPPEKSIARVVKPEPVEEPNINPATRAMLAMISPKVGPASRQKRTRHRQAVVDLTDVDDAPDDNTHPNSTAHHEATHDFGHSAPLQQSARVPSTQLAPKSPSRLMKRPLLTQEQLNAMDLLPIPQDRLQEVQNTYRQFNQVLPSHVTTWAALKIFAAQHPIPLLDPDNIRHAQTQWFHTMKSPLIQSLPPSPTAYSIPSAMLAATAEPCRSVSRLPQLKQEESDTSSNTLPQRNNGQSKIISGYRRLREQRKTRNSAANIMLTSIPADETLNMAPTAPVLTDLQIQRIMEPLDTLPELLPTDAPENHPHLVQIWDLALISLPRERHDHLNLIDTAVSIIYKYDEDMTSTIQAFFNTEKVKHFFFLFKSRTNKFHSWSIEREGDLVTIGIERNQRAPNVTPSESPSAGQYDLTLCYQLRRYPSPTHTANDEATVDKSLAYWTPVGTSVFPAQPSITDFLYNTPPNRGADSHENFTNPNPSTTSKRESRSAFQSQGLPFTQKIPPDRLSILARYMQNTAFTVTALEADFQVCWGHRVRYDAVIGRIRAAFTNAIKGAATQARKREAGEYNRPIPAGLSTNKGSEKPGSGAAIGHLRGESGTDSSKTELDTSKKRTADGSEIENDGAEGEEEMRSRKRMRSGRRSSRQSSGSEYVNSEREE